ncbi:hypothetical protein [Streptomyces sp. AN091965]|uniref:hypothetical protein n=1 Tax=Streptomyces sp. AN091965 TaxID=2927803 RepID=UPI001F61631A|nr:hypothetical protein [Streptomyces sp. AN091965]MCI3932700.1 hypothetical protein [Streptomyces sp. AN091965]
MKHPVLLEWADWMREMGQSSAAIAMRVSRAHAVISHAEVSPHELTNAHLASYFASRHAPLNAHTEHRTLEALRLLAAFLAIGDPTAGAGRRDSSEGCPQPTWERLDTRRPSTEGPPLRLQGRPRMSGDTTPSCCCEPASIGTCPVCLSARARELSRVIGALMAKAEDIVTQGHPRTGAQLALALGDLAHIADRASVMLAHAASTTRMHNPGEPQELRSA